MSGFGRKFTAAAIAVALCTVPTVAVAAAPVAPPPAAPAATAPASPWVTLSAMTTSSASASNTAIRHTDEHAGFPPVAALVVILATIGVAIWILLADDEDDDLGISPD